MKKYLERDIHKEQKTTDRMIRLFAPFSLLIGTACIEHITGQAVPLDERFIKPQKHVMETQAKGMVLLIHLHQWMEKK